MEEISYLLAAAAVGGFAITAVSGKFMIPALHRLHFGQTVREEGPTWHNKKNGTPTCASSSASWSRWAWCGGCSTTSCRKSWACPR